MTENKKINIDAELHTKTKVLASKKGKSMKELLSEILTDALGDIENE